MTAIHNIELDLFARTATGEEINLGKVQVPITIDVNPRPTSGPFGTREREARLQASTAKRRAITPEQFDNMEESHP